MTLVLGYTFIRPELAAAALSHPSVHGKKLPEGEHFERLEFLGDRVISLVMADWLMAQFPNEAEGPLTRRHTALVRAGAMAVIARESGLLEQLQLAGDAPGENILADALEAMLGAIYLDGGFEPAAKLVRELWAKAIAHEPSDLRDPKTRLQELAQTKGPQLPQYEVIEQHGPSHAPLFHVKVTLADGQQAKGEGSSKRAAEQAAAAALLDKVEKNG